MSLLTTIVDAVIEKVNLNTTHRGKTDNPHGVTKAQVGLGSVDNTSDASKPVSTATQTALNLKVAITDIRDNLTSLDTNKPLSANQGKILKGLIDDINAILTSDDTTLDQIQEIVNFIKQNKADLDTLGISNIAGLQAALDNKVDDSQVLTNVPSGAKFTDTVYTHPSTHPASIITTTDEFAYSNSTNVQDVLDDLDQAITNVNTKAPVITLTGDVTGSGTMTNLGSVSITATVADDSHNHVISNVDGLQTALDNKQPLDGDLTSIAALAGTAGILKKTAANTWTLDTSAYSTTVGTVTSIATSGAITGGTITSSGTISHSTADGFLHVPATSTTNNGKVLTAGATAGAISWVTPTFGTLTSVSGTAPVVSSGGNTPTISMAAATALVNGYMSSTYASKLDGIEAGATGDQTANEILALIKTVDGSTSGLDADLLDGLDSTSAATASTIVARDSSADINVRLLRANYADQATISGGIAFRVNNSTDNYTRYCSSPLAIRTYLDTINASNLTSGIVPDGRISGSYTGMTNLTGTGTVDFSKFYGNTADTVAAPSFSWTGDTNTGIYQPTADQLAVTCGGVQKALFSSAGITGTLVGNASTATKLGSIGTTFSGTYPMTVNAAGVIYSHTGITYDGAANRVITSNINATTAIELGDTQQASIAYNSVSNSIDFIIN